MELALLLFYLLAVFGCDGVIDSETSIDGCGVCGGNNATCDIITGIYSNPALDYGYNFITEIPMHSCQIEIHQLHQTRNYLALRLRNGTFFLNGYNSKNGTGTYEGAGTTFAYLKQGAGVEKIVSLGPLKESIDLMLFHQHLNLGLRYKYSIPKKPHFEIAVANDALAQHLDARKPLLIRHQHGKDNFVYNGTLVKYARVTDDMLYTDGTIHHRRHNHSKVRRKKFRWHITGYSDCSKPCSGGFKTPVLICVRDHKNTLTPVPDKRCLNEEKPIVEKQRCRSEPCLPEWTALEWSSCSVSCGEGMETRKVFCSQTVNENITLPVPSGACVGDQPSDTRKCIQPSCSAVKSDETCNENGNCLDKPLGLQPDDKEGFWIYSPWSNECSEQCGKKIERRTVRCFGRNCNEKLKPEETRTCQGVKCLAAWFTGAWQKCSGICDIGEQTRDVICVISIDGDLILTHVSNCDFNTKPPNRQLCSLSPCDTVWYTSDWTSCSASCGKGTQKREIVCFNNNESITSCPIANKPGEMQYCNNHSCYTKEKTKKLTIKHIQEQCLDKLPNCRTAVQARLCSYTYYEEYCCKSCSTRKY